MGLHLLRPPNTPPWSAAIVYTILFTASVVNLTVAWYARISEGSLPPWASPIWIGLEAGNLVVTAMLLWVIGGLSLASPEVLSRVVSLMNITVGTRGKRAEDAVCGRTRRPSNPLAMAHLHLDEPIHQIRKLQRIGHGGPAHALAHSADFHPFPTLPRNEVFNSAAQDLLVK